MSGEIAEGEVPTPQITLSSGPPLDTIQGDYASGEVTVAYDRTSDGCRLLFVGGASGAPGGGMGGLSGSGIR